MLIFTGGHLQTSLPPSPSWLDSVLGQSKQGTAVGFEGENNTVVELGDGDSAMLECKVFLRQEKTVRLFYTFKLLVFVLRYLG